MMLLQNKNIAIIGGGPGGLTLAKLLQLKGVEVKVYERDIDRNVRLQGGALDLHTESGLAALEKAGLLSEFKTRYRPGAERIRILDDQANIHYDEHINARNTDFGAKDHRPEIDRGPLRDILLDSLEPNTVIWNSHIVNLCKVNDKWKIEFENGLIEFADMVIGADGSNSKIRKFVTDIKPFWTGIIMIEGSLRDAEKTAPHIHQLLKGGKIFAYGNSQSLLVSSKGDGSFGFAASFKCPEFWDKQSGIDFRDHTKVLSWFKREFSFWGEVWHELFTSETTLFIPRPQYCMPLDQQWKAQSDITLIGDAAHWMPPFAGEGVNMAMLDALQLSETLTNDSFSNTKEAIGSYEKKMFKRFSKIGEVTLFNTKWMHSKNALKDMLNMFGKSKLKQVVFMIKYGWATEIIPFIRRVSYMAPNQKVLR